MDLYTVDIHAPKLIESISIKPSKVLNEKEKRISKVVQNINRKKMID